jgi:hypothetical protein
MDVIDVIGTITSLTGEKLSFDQSFKLSKVINNMLKENENVKQNIPLKFSTDIITRTIEFCKQYHSDSFSLQEKPVNINILPKWCIKLIDLQMDYLVELIKIANVLDIDVLIDVICIKIASLI